MSRKFIYYYAYRHFSSARILRNLEKVKPTEPEKAPSSYQELKYTFVPSNFDKKVLVWSGRYKSLEDIPSRISHDTLEVARSRFRIKFASLLMIVTVFMCGFYVWLGKKKASEGDSINKRYSPKVTFSKNRSDQ